MENINKKIKYKEDLIENIKIALEECLEKTNNITLEDKEISIMIYCNNTDRLIGVSKNDIALKFLIGGINE